MKLVVGTNGERDFTRAVLRASEGGVDEVYLSVLASRYSSGRPNVHDVGFGELQKTAVLARRHGVRVSVAFNAPCYSGRETQADFRREYLDLLDRVTECGVERVILSHPVMVILTKRERPAIHVTVSSFNMIDSVESLAYFADMGADRVVLAAEVNRHLNTLTEMARRFRELELEILVNNGCDYYCPFEFAHGSCQSHGHEKHATGRKQYPKECVRGLLEQPWRLLMSPFVRPEDLEAYEGAGVRYFKLAGRNTNRDWMENVVDAYQRRRYDGNIVDILNRTYSLSTFRRPNRVLMVPNPRLCGLLAEVSSCAGHAEMSEVCRRTYRDVVESGANG